MDKGKHSRDPRHNQDNRSPQSPNVASPVPPDQGNSASRNCVKHSKYEITRDVLGIALTFLTAAFSGWAVYYFYGQWKEAQRQTIIQRNASMAAERAWLYISSGNITYPPAGNGSVSAATQMQVTNGGKTPGRQVYIEATIRIEKNGTNWEPCYGGLLESEISNVIGPGKTDTPFVVSLMEPTVALSQTDMQELKVGSEYFATFARMTYQDSFGVWHWEHYCSWGTPAGRGSFSARLCAAYNEMDRMDLDERAPGSLPTKDPYFNRGVVISPAASADPPSCHAKRGP